MADETKKENVKPMTRRYFLEAIGGGAIGIAATGSVVLTAQFLSPNVLREPPSKFKAGAVEEFPVGSVTLNKEQKVFIVRAKEGYFYTVSAGSQVPPPLSPPPPPAEPVSVSNRIAV